MTNIIDATVVNKLYDTSGNGGRKLVRLSDNTLVSVVKYGFGIYYVYKSTDGINWTLIPTGSFSSLQDICLSTNGRDVYILASNNNNNIHMSRLINDGSGNFSFGETQTIDTSQTELGNVSLFINQQGTELHAAWASKNSTYPNSFNIRYAKGTINTDGTVTWGAVEQVTNINTSGTNIQSPSIILDKNNIPHILHTWNNVSFNYVIEVTKAFTTIEVTNGYSNNGWGNKRVYDGSTYIQSSPSAIFVPQSVNGLVNGRMWVAWHGSDSTETNENIRATYSDDGGATWSTMQKLTTGQIPRYMLPSITANKNNEIFIVAEKYNYDGIIKIKITNGVWGAVQTVLSDNGTTSNNNFPSTLYDLSVNFTEPLFIYKNNRASKVGFYGTWTVTNISVPQGSIGKKSDKNNILSYNITTDGEMGTITEKVNGVVVGTKTLANGESTTVSITQDQWDAIKYGKYADAKARLNTLTIEMGSDKWTYTFDKRLGDNDELPKFVMALEDEANVYIPSIKRMITDKFGGNTSDSFEKIIAGIIPEKKASGVMPNASDVNASVRGLAFRPTLIFSKGTYGASRNGSYVYIYEESSNTNVSFLYYGGSWLVDTGVFTVYANGFDLVRKRAGSESVENTWVAIG